MNHPGYIKMFAALAGAGTVASVMMSMNFVRFAETNHVVALAACGESAEELAAHADRRYLRRMFGMIALQAMVVAASGYYLHRGDPIIRTSGFIVGGVFGTILFEGAFVNSNFLKTLAK